jgi:hypothetical protein
MDKFYFPVDFVVLETKPIPDSHKLILVILGGPFLATANAYINYRTEVMALSFGNMKAKLNIFNVAHQPQDESECFFLDSVVKFVDDTPHDP